MKKFKNPIEEYKYKEKWRKRINAITEGRMIAGFGLIPIYLIKGGFWAGIFSALLWSTDWIDGLLSRKKGTSTFGGALLDVLSDKTFAFLNLTLLAIAATPWMVVPIVLEVVISLINWNGFKNGNNVKSSILGKVKTFGIGLTLSLGFAFLDLPTLQSALNFLKINAFDNLIQVLQGIDSAKILEYTVLPAVITQVIVATVYYIKNQKSKIEKTEEELKTNTINEVEIVDIFNDKEKYAILKQKLKDWDYYQQHKDDDIAQLVINTKDYVSNVPKEMDVNQKLKLKR